MRAHTALSDAIVAGDRDTVARETGAALDAGAAPAAILDAMKGALDVVGARFQAGEVFVPEMLLSARAMQAGMAILEPILTASGIHPEHTAVIGTVKGDIHDIGKNIVAMLWRGAGFEVVDLGTNVPPQRFVAAAREHGAEIVGISALLSTTMLNMPEAVAAIRAAGLDGVAVIVGGAPVTAEFAATIGADGFAPDAGAAVEVARRAVGMVAPAAGRR